MFTGMELMACQNLAVSAQVMQHVVHVESSANPYAIGVVGGRLVRQPQNLGEALATVRMLDAGNYNYSLGLAQVNRANLDKYGLDSYQKAFMPCPNVAAGAQILADCYTNSGNDWGKAFSCYYSGNFVTGYRDGYVRKIYDSMRQSAKLPAAAGEALVAAKQASPSPPQANRDTALPPSPGSSAYRVAIRSVAIDTAAVAASSAWVTAKHDAEQLFPAALPAPAAPGSTTAWAIANAPGAAAAEPGNPTATEVFVPRVRGPDDPSPSNAPPLSARVVSAPPPNGGGVDHAHPLKEHRDAAFVF